MTKSSDLSIMGHLDELRERLIKCITAVLACSLILYCLFIDHILSAIIQPVGKIVFTAPAEAFMARINLSFLGGLILAMPIVLFQVWRFVSAGLKEHERKYITIFAPFSLFSFLAGNLFAYFVMIPISLQFLLGFASDSMVPMITISKYISFIGSMVLVFGVVFELPLVLMFLTRIGVATPEFLIQKRRHAIVLVLVISAFLTPPDIVTLLVMAAPLIVLYEVGVCVSKITYKVKGS